MATRTNTSSSTSSSGAPLPLLSSLAMRLFVLPLLWTLLSALPSLRRLGRNEQYNNQFVSQVQAMEARAKQVGQPL